MKKINIYFFAVAVLFMSACEDYLDVTPVTDLTDENFYRTPDDAYTALVGVYDGLQVTYSNGVSFPVASAVFSDNAFGGTGAADGFGYQMIDRFDESVSPADQNMFVDTWSAYYAAVYRCNTFLQKLGQVDWTNNEELKATFEAEARFIRAYLYFDMVRLWGNIPLLTEPSAENVEQADPADVYEVIAQDLKFAADSLDSNPYTAQDPATYGRVTKWAAEALLARVYLFYTGYYDQSDLVGVVSQDEALAYLEDVIANGGFGLLEDYADLWPAASVADYAGEDNQETVFAIKYTYTSDYDGNTDGNHWLVMLGLREQSIYPYGNGWGAATVNPELWNAYSENDTRRSASIIAIEEEELPFENVANQREYTGYYVKKYTPMVNEDGTPVVDGLGEGSFQISQFQDFVSIRYADVLLMAAELGSANAQTYLDQVRQRALKNSFTSVPVTQENIMEERRLELAFEALRYWDLLRQGVEHAAEEISETIVLQSAGEEDEVTILENNIIETQGLQQIPYTQITLSNGVLEQNKGW